MHHGYQQFGATTVKPKLTLFTPEQSACIAQLRAQGAAPNAAIQQCAPNMMGMTSGSSGGVPWYAWAGLAAVAAGAGWWFFVRSPA